MAHVDTRKFGGKTGGRVSVHAPNNADLEENPCACARTWAMTPAELEDHKKRSQEEAPRPSQAKRFLAG